jgi:hypothetical protein
MRPNCCAVREVITLRSGSYGETSLQVKQKLRAPVVRAEDKGGDRHYDSQRRASLMSADVGCDPSAVTELLVRFRPRLLVTTLVRRTNLRKYRSTGWKVVSNQQMVSIQPVQTSQCCFSPTESLHLTIRLRHTASASLYWSQFMSPISTPLRDTIVSLKSLPFSPTSCTPASVSRHPLMDTLLERVMSHSIGCYDFH